MRLPFFQKRDRFPALEVGLQKLAGKRAYEEILRRCPDKRTLTEVAAEYLQVDERDLIAKIAAVLQLRVAPRVIPTEAHNLPKGVTLKSQRQAGFIAVYRDGVFRGILCTNPATIFEPFRSYENLEMLIAPWGDIARALGESEEALEKRRIVEQANRENRENSLLHEVLSVLIEEVESHERNEVKLIIERHSIRYLFTTTDGRTGRGEINKALGSALLRFLQSDGAQLSQRMLTWKSLEPGRYYVLSWDPAAETMAPDYGLEDPSDETNRELTLAQSERTPDEVATGQKKQKKFTVSVLLIDDNDAFGAVVERFFVREGITVERRTNAEEALNQIRNGKLRPKVIVCDLHMPGMNGVQFLKALRKTSAFLTSHIFMLTSDDNIENEVDAIYEGVEAYLRKGEDPRLLCAHVQRVLNGKKVLAEAA